MRQYEKHILESSDCQNHERGTEIYVHLIESLKSKAFDCHPDEEIKPMVLRIYEIKTREVKLTALWNFLDHEVSDTRMDVTQFSRDCYFTSVIPSIKTLMEKYNPVPSEKYQF